MNLKLIAQDLAEEFAPLIIGNSGTTKTFTAEQASALYTILVYWGYPDEVPKSLIDGIKEMP